MHFVEAKGILSAGNGMNIYRGCSHGCIYCDSRSKCYGFTHEYEDIEVKKNAPELLENINDTEENINGILDYCVRAGVKGIICFGMGVTMRDGDREYFYKALDEHFPGLKKRYIRTYGNAYELSSPHHDRLMEIFTDVCRENGIMYKAEDCFSYLHEYPDKYEQMTFWDLI